MESSSQALQRRQNGCDEAGFLDLYAVEAKVESRSQKCVCRNLLAVGGNLKKWGRLVFSQM